jgi:uncharacterized protein YwqG
VAQFGGTPLLAPGERWPICNDCKKPMQFFLQIPLASLPDGFARRGDGTLQMFYCSTDDGDCETWAPFSGTQLVRLLNGPATPVAHPRGLAPLPARAIERWDELVDYPHSEEHERLGVSHRFESGVDRVTVACEELGIEVRNIAYRDVDEIGLPAEGDKLGGWPFWIQTAEYPACSECGTRMELVLQLDSEDNVPHMFGDGGCGHITQCPAHPNVLAFGWACL